jgi:putative glutamine amidotransferase
VSRPVIGLTTYREEAAWGVWHQRADLLHTEYADTVVAAGGVPVLLPPATDDPDAAAAVIAQVRGLIVCGGADVDPARYDAEPHDRTAGWRPDRDAWELALLEAAAAADLPVLGVCRGMQVMAVHAGGVLDQHTPDVVGHEQHSPGGDQFGDIRVSTEPDSRLASLIGPEVKVACHHHQSVREAPGFRFTAHAEDGTAEAMEAPDGRFRIGVQWHPEMRTELALFRGLVQAAAG